MRRTAIHRPVPARQRQFPRRRRRRLDREPHPLPHRGDRDRRRGRRRRPHRGAPLPNEERQGVNDSNPGPLFEAAATALSKLGIAFLEVREPGFEGTNGRPSGRRSPRACTPPSTAPSCSTPTMTAPGRRRRSMRRGRRRLLRPPLHRQSRPPARLQGMPLAADEMGNVVRGRQARLCRLWNGDVMGPVGGQRDPSRPLPSSKHSFAICSSKTSNRVVPSIGATESRPIGLDPDDTPAARVVASGCNVAGQFARLGIATVPPQLRRRHIGHLHQKTPSRAKPVIETTFDETRLIVVDPPAIETLIRSSGPDTEALSSRRGAPAPRPECRSRGWSAPCCAGRAARAG